MSSPLEVVVWIVVGALLVSLVVALRRMGWLGPTDRRASTGMGAWLQDMNAMLQPNQPRAEEIRRVAEEADENEDEDGDAGPSGPTRAPPARRPPAP